MLVLSTCAARRILTTATSRSHIRVKDLIRTASLRNTAKSPAAFIPRRLHSRYFATRSNMASLESITQSLSGLSITPAATVSHTAASSPQAWREALEASSSAPKSFELIKTLVYKPKTAKTATPVPLVVIARENTDVLSGSVAKKLNLKEPRLAAEDLLTEFFSLDKNSRALHILYYSLRHLSCTCSLSPGAERRDFPQGHHRRRFHNRGINVSIRCSRTCHRHRPFLDWLRPMTMFFRPRGSVLSSCNVHPSTGRIAFSSTLKFAASEY